MNPVLSSSIGHAHFIHCHMSFVVAQSLNIYFLDSTISLHFGHAVPLVNLL
ncbi:hypothetical protein ES332_D13G159100v1 [Gossypium tomentosum]|uniref:Uncharacterized protein n=1 Tax=Gossypium tomentosum TaxID=34277 RepID=A0A5D2HZ36_GOSTO|nr:hypothetical protein ES332_D13G159100v1 [Gossypium tomentosum]